MTIQVNMQDAKDAIVGVFQKQADLIAQKAALRTAAFQGKFYSTPAVEKSPRVTAFEAALVTPGHLAYRNTTALVAFNALLDAGEIPADMPTIKTVEFDRAVVIVALDVPGYKWADKFPVGQPLICVHIGRGAFRTASFDKVYVDTNAGNAIRPATDDEIASLINSIINTAHAPAFVKNLGEADAAQLLGLTGSSDSE